MLSLLFEFLFVFVTFVCFFREKTAHYAALIRRWHLIEGLSVVEPAVEVTIKRKKKSIFLEFFLIFLLFWNGPVRKMLSR